MKKILTYFIVAIITVLTGSYPVSALSPDQERVIDSQVRYFNIEDAAATCSNDSVNLIGNDNIEKAYGYFIGKGLTPEQAAGIVGNFVVESNGVDPTAFNPSGGGQGAFGIAQWRGGRQTNLRNFATEQNKDVNSLELQLQFVWHELQTSESLALAELQKTTSVEDATLSFDKFYERSGGSIPQKRLNAAHDVFTNYSVPSGVAGSIGQSSLNCAGGNGEDTQFVDGFTVYSQYDPEWKDLPYGTSTIGDSGCGPSAMAMIITTLTGESVTPIDTANYAAEQGLYTPGVGSSWQIAPILAAHWGLKSEPLARELTEITTALRAGKLVIVSGQGAKPFTSEGHFLVIRGLTADGKFKIGDSGHTDTSDKEWDPEQLIANMKAGSIYAIFK